MLKFSERVILQSIFILDYLYFLENFAFFYMMSRGSKGGGGKWQGGLFPICDVPSCFTQFFSMLAELIENGRQIWRQACLNMTFRKMYLDATRMNQNWLLSLFISFEKESKWETYLADYIFYIFLKKDLSQLCPPFTNLF